MKLNEMSIILIVKHFLTLAILSYIFLCHQVHHNNNLVKLLQEILLLHFYVKQTASYILNTPQF